MSKHNASSQDKFPLTSGISVPRAVHDELLRHAEPRIQKLKFRKRYKAKQMFDPNFYERHDPWLIGCCVADWERTKKVPLRFLGCRYCSVRYYERI